jgi:hypothetical protein
MTAPFDPQPIRDLIRQQRLVEEFIPSLETMLREATPHLDMVLAEAGVKS